MNIKVYEQPITDELMALLLTADPDKTVILSYIENAIILVCESQELLIGAVVLTQQNGIMELKNIAVLAEYQNKGIAKRLITQAKKLAVDSGICRMEVATGNSSFSPLALYQKCGFRLYAIDSDYFESYPEPIFENGIRCIDRVCLYLEL